MLFLSPKRFLMIQKKKPFAVTLEGEIKDVLRIIENGARKRFSFYLCSLERWRCIKRQVPSFLLPLDTRTCW